MSKSKVAKAVKKPKDPNAPKKNQSSFFIFSNERRANLQQENPGKAVTDISKIISIEWKKIDPDTKKQYDSRAAESKKKYLAEMEEYQQTQDFKNYQKKLDEWKENEKASGRGTSTTKSGKSGSKALKKPKQPEAMPKRPQSSYFLFSNERRNELKEQYPEKKITDLSKLIANEWKAKTAAEKKEYENKALELKGVYTKEMDKYKLTDEYKAYQQALEDFKKASKNGPAADEDSDGGKVSLPRKPKDDACPKRPLSSYFLYAQEVRQQTKEEHPSKPVTDIAREISKKWKELSEEEKKPYNDEALRLKEQWKKDMKEYEGSEAQEKFQQKLEAWKTECESRRAKHKLKKQKQSSSSSKKSPKNKGKTKGKTKGGKGKVKSGGKGKNKKKMDTSDSDESSSDDEGDSASESGSESGSDSESSSSASASGSGSESGSDSDSESESD